MVQHKPLFLEDLTVGSEFRSGEYHLDEARIHEFARQFDPQPFHLDRAAAEASFFHGLAASGWHTGAITMRLLVDSMPLGCGLIGAGVELKWPQPTRPDDILHVTSKVLDIALSRSKPDRGIVTIECLTLNQRGETCQRMVAHLLVMRRPEQQ